MISEPFSLYYISLKSVSITFDNIAPIHLFINNETSTEVVLSENY